MHVVDALLARPAQLVHASIHHEAHGAKQFGLEPAEVVVGVVLESHLPCESLCIKRPALGMRMQPERAAELRDVSHRLHATDLQVMSRNGLVIGEGAQAETRVLLYRPEVDEEHAGAGAVQRGAHVIGAESRGLAILGNAADLDIGGRAVVKPAVQAGADLCDDLPVRFEDGLAAGGAVLEQEPRLGVKRRHARADTTFAVAFAAQDRVHFAFDARHLGESQRVQLVRAELGGGMSTQHPAVVILSVRKRPDAVVRRSAGQQHLEVINEVLVGRLHVGIHCRGQLSLEGCPALR